MSGSGASKKGFELNFASIDKRRPHHPYDGELGIDIAFYFEGEYLGDIDNLLKSLFDAMQKDHYLVNDRQIRVVKAEIIENSLLQGIRIILNKH